MRRAAGPLCQFSLRQRRGRARPTRDSIVRSWPSGTETPCHGDRLCGLSATRAGVFTVTCQAASTYDEDNRLLSRTVDDGDNSEDRHTVYDWEDNGASSTALLGETTYDGLIVDPNEKIETRTNSYNARGRLASSVVEDHVASKTTTTEFEYDDAGLRIRQTRDDGTTVETREFVFDPQNPTGYAQTLEEVLVDGGRSVDKAFTVGLDVISQALANATTGGSNPLAAKEPGTFIYDGHGSVRMIADEIGQAVQIALRELGGAGTDKIDYEAYGEAINAAISTAITQLLYSGEFTDAINNNQYLRARYYDFASGRFNRVDPFAGNMHVPQSLHKYLYAHADPVLYSDPSGQVVVAFAIGLLTGILLQIAVIGLRSSSALHVGPGEYVPVDPALLQVHYHSVRISNAATTADAMFKQMALFSQRDLGVVRALDDADGLGDTITFDMKNWVDWKGPFREAGQANFKVHVTMFDEASRRLAVRTLSGHPLAGWRYWEISHMPGGDLLIETFSVEHPFAKWDEVKNYAGGLDAMYQTWESLLNELARQSGGQIVNDPNTSIKGTQKKHVLPYLNRIESP